MRTRPVGGPPQWATAAALALLTATTGAAAFAQPPVPPAAPAPAPASAPPPPSPTTPAATVSNEELLRRLQQMEAMNRALLQRIETLESQAAKLAEMAEGEESEPEPSGLAGQGGFKEPHEEHPKKGLSQRAIEESGARSSGVQAMPYAQEAGNRYLGKIPLKAFLDYGRQGIGLETADQEFLLKFRGEFQADTMVYSQVSSLFKSGFYLPRSRYYFQGHYTRPINYQISFQQSYTRFGFLNVFLNFNYDHRLQLRVGRFKVPFTYEWYKLNNWRLITPERSLFPLNFGLNRQVGLMAWGQLREGRTEYAAGIFDGPRNSSQDYNTAKDVIALLNFRPFLLRTDSFLKDLNIGGSMAYGVQDNPVNPAALRTNSNASAEGLTADSPINNATVPFLAFNSDVRERGPRELWELHLAYYYNGLSLISSWGAGVESYARRGAAPTKVPIDGFSVALAYLLTGEVLNERTLVDPIHRFDLRPGKFGLGAFEPFFRYSYLNLGDQVFRDGYADPNLWTNRVGLTDLGLNWYLNRGVKIYFDWQHALFSQPVFLRPGVQTRTNDLFWMRFQLYY
jgi:phosphate-selective porin OprO/OprP